MDLEKQNLEDEKKNAAESLRILEEKAKQENDASDETANAIAAARAKMYDAERAYYDGTRRLNSQLLTAQEEMRQEAAKAASDWFICTSITMLSCAIYLKFSCICSLMLTDNFLLISSTADLTAVE